MTATIAAVIAALCLVESGNDPRAVGDNGRAVGILQAWPCAVFEACRLEAIAARREGRSARAWTLADRWDAAASREMCAVTLAHWWRRGVREPVALACRWRNPSGDAPTWYAERVRRALAQIPCQAAQKSEKAGK